MDIRDGFIGAIGNTPLIKLKKASELTGCTILGKAEFPQSRRFGQGPRRALHHRGCRAEGRAPQGRP